MKTRILFPIVAVSILIISIVLGMNLLTEPPVTPSYFDDNVIYLERTTCFETCPVYSVTVFKNGIVIFEGIEFVENIGIFEYRIPTRDAEKIFDKFYEINYFALQDRYDVETSDLPTVITSFRNDSYEKTVSNYGNAGPDKLHELELTIDRLAKTKSMIDDAIPAKTKKIASVFEMKPNSMEFFYYPNPEDTTNRDAFQKFMLIRLPESIGGNAQDVSAFRAYSAMSISDHCLVKYWPEEGRKRIENPCRGDVYRAVDGLVIMGIDRIKNTSPMALPYLELSIDKDGLLYVEPPVFTPDRNGVIGIGRHISNAEIREGSQMISEGFAKSNPYFPKFPINFAGLTLTHIEQRNRGAEGRYVDLSSMSGFMSIYIQQVTAQESDYHVNLAKSNSEFWQIGDYVITTDDFDTHFIKDGYKFSIRGENPEFIRKEVVKNFFPEYGYDDMFLISSTVE